MSDFWQKHIHFIFFSIDYTMCESESESHSVVSNSWDLMDYTVPGILWARIWDWVAILSSRGSSQPRGWSQVSRIAGGFLTSWATQEDQYNVWINGQGLLSVWLWAIISLSDC